MTPLRFAPLNAEDASAYVWPAYSSAVATPDPASAINTPVAPTMQARTMFSFICDLHRSAARFTSETLRVRHRETVEKSLSRDPRERVRAGALCRCVVSSGPELGDGRISKVVWREQIPHRRVGNDVALTGHRP